MAQTWTLSGVARDFLGGASLRTDARQLSGYVEPSTPEDRRDALQRAMTLGAGVRRDAASLAAAARQVETARTRS